MAKIISKYDVPSFLTIDEHEWSNAIDEYREHNDVKNGKAYEHVITACKRYLVRTRDYLTSHHKEFNLDEFLNWYELCKRQFFCNGSKDACQFIIDYFEFEYSLLVTLQEEIRLDDELQAEVIENGIQCYDVNGQYVYE